MNKENNLAFIDGQNLYMGTTRSDKPWKIDLSKFKVYLERKYSVTEAYYFLGYKEDDHDLYTRIQKAGFIVIFKKHSQYALTKKKGNVDADIVFDVMKRLYKKEIPDKVLLISGDGDYKMMVDFLIEENKFRKILFPNRKFASSLYKPLGNNFCDSIEKENIKRKIEFI